MWKRGVVEIERGPDALVLRVRTGVQTNCGGIAEIRVRIERSEVTELRDESEDMPERLVGATLAGSRAVLDRSDRTLRFVLLGGLVHPIDGNARRFEEAGAAAVQHALDTL